MTRDVLITPATLLEDHQLSDIQDHLWSAGAPVVALLDPDLYVVEGDPATVQAVLDQAREQDLGEWVMISDPRDLPDYGADYVVQLAAWALTADDDLVVAEHGVRPDDGQSFAALSGCGQ